MDWKTWIGDLATPDQVAGGSVLAFVLFLVSRLWAGYKEFKKERLDNQENEAKRERDRQGRIDGGFQKIDAGREALVASLQQMVTTLNDQLTLNAKRYQESLLFKDEQIRIEIARRAAVEENLTEGWDKGRSMEVEVHTLRHAWNNSMQAIYTAGRLKLPMPEWVQRIYDAGKTGNEFPADLRVPIVPELQYMPRKSATEAK